MLKDNRWWFYGYLMGAYVGSAIIQDYKVKSFCIISYGLVLFSYKYINRYNLSSICKKKIWLALLFIAPTYFQKTNTYDDIQVFEINCDKEIILWVDLDGSFENNNYVSGTIKRTSLYNNSIVEKCVFIKDHKLKFLKGKYLKIKTTIKSLIIYKKKIFLNNIFSFNVISKNNIVEGLDNLAFKSNWLFLSDWNKFARSMIFGRPEILDRNIRQIFAQGGGAHLLAVSGLHIGIVYAFFHFSFSFVFFRGINIALSLGLSFLYVLVVGCPESAVRAFLMIFIHQFGSFMNVSVNPVFSLCCAGLAMLALTPASLWSLGFQLSFTVVLMILFVLPPVNNKFFRKKFISYLFLSFIVSFSASAGSSLLIIQSFKILPLGSMLSNFFISPFVLPFYLMSIFNIVLIYFFNLSILDIFVKLLYSFILNVNNYFSSFCFSFSSYNLIFEIHPIFRIFFFFIFFILSFSAIKWIHRFLILIIYYTALCGVALFGYF